MARILIPAAGEHEARRSELLRPSPCSACAAPMAWIRTPSGARAPLSIAKARPFPCPECIPDGPPDVCGLCGCSPGDAAACLQRARKACTPAAPGLCSVCLELGPATPRRCGRCESRGVVYLVLSHFVDCPDASKFKRRGKGKA